MTASTDVCVVVPTFKRPTLLRRCLQALLEQTVNPACYEIVVVDDGRDAATSMLVAGMAKDRPMPRLRYLRPPRGRGPAVARNAGWRATSAPLVAFTDDDTQPDPDWLRAGLAQMQAEPDWVAAAGQVLVPRDPPLARPTDHERMTLGLETAEFVTANAFVRRRALVRVNGFDERFLRPWREDTDLQFRLQQIGTVGRAPRARVWHPVRPERWGVSLRQQRNVFFDALLYRKHPQLYRQRVRAQPPWDYYAVVLLSLLALGCALAGQPSAAGWLLLPVLLLVLHLAWRRLKPCSRAPAHVVEMLVTSALIPFLSVFWRLRGAWHFRTPFL